MKRYQQLTLKESNFIRLYKQAGRNIREIAELLCREPSTICRELRRNTGFNGYQPNQAEKFASARKWRGGHPTLTAAMVMEIESKLREKMTPAIISKRARLEGRKMVSHERIYQYVIEDAARGGDLWRNLPRSHRRREGVLVRENYADGLRIKR